MAKKKKTKKKRFDAVSSSLDVLPKDGPFWQSFLEAEEKISEIYDFNFLELPLFEFKELFESAIGDGGNVSSSSIVGFDVDLSKTKKKLAFRPELNTSLMRSYMENQLGRFSSPLRSYYRGPVIREDSGEIKETHETGFSIIGDSDVIYDIEVITALVDFLSEVKIKDPILKINSPGCRVCRPGLEKKVKKHYRYHKKKLCDDCLVKYDKAPMYLLNCDKKKCVEIKEEAPSILNCLCQSCNNHFKDILELIEDNKINYIPDPYFLGEVDYYSKIAFKIVPNPESDLSLATGGRLDYLSERIGGRQLPATGGVLHMENIIDYLQEKEVDLNPRKRRRIFFVSVGKEAKKNCTSLIKELRDSSIVVMESLGKKSLNAQLKVAEKSDASLVLIYGQKEVFEDTIIIKNLETGAQETVPLSKMLDTVRNRI